MPLEKLTHVVPFMALMSKVPTPPNRPMLTRLTEQALVGVIASFFGAILAVKVLEVEFKNLDIKVDKNEERAMLAHAELTRRFEEGDKSLKHDIDDLRRIRMGR